MLMVDNFRFGIEEEYFLVDAETKRVARRMPEKFLMAANNATDGHVTGEFLQSQIEVTTSPDSSLPNARSQLRGLRQIVATIAAEHGLAILAAGTHPTAIWGNALQTPKQRYNEVMNDLQMIGQRNMLCGMHVHVELPDPDERVDVMCRMLPYLPLFLALSTSSPFWQSRSTGLMGYRLAAYDELPRTGVPELFRTKEEFDAYIAAQVKAGIIADSSYIWWAIRPSLAHPTLELRAPDCRTLMRHLYYNPWRNHGMTAVSRALVVENKWRAQRYGVHGTFVTEEGAVTVAEMLERVIEETAADAQALGCAEEIAHCRKIVGDGTSADAQLAVFQEQRGHKNRKDALQAVSDWIAGATLQG